MHNAQSIRDAEAEELAMDLMILSQRIAKAAATLNRTARAFNAARNGLDPEPPTSIAAARAKRSTQQAISA